MMNTKWKDFIGMVGLSLVAVGLTTPVLAPIQAEASAVDRIVDTNSNNVATSANPDESIQRDANGNTYYSPKGEFSNVNAKDANNWAKEKGGDLIGFFTTIAEPLAVVIFILSAIMMMVGALAKSDWFKRGVLGMAIAVLMWTAVTFAPELILFGSEWLST